LESKKAVSALIKMVIIALIMGVALIIQLLMRANHTGATWIPVTVGLIASAAVWQSGKNNGKKP
jgi:hypothetical protein